MNNKKYEPVEIEFLRIAADVITSSGAFDGEDDELEWDTN